MLMLYWLFGMVTSVELVTVKVKQGWLRGELLTTSSGDHKYYSFKRIPYAAPTLRKSRFKTNQPPISLKNIKDATRHRPKCIQKGSFSTKLPECEDCPSLNVYSPDLKPGEPMPVIIFINGGIFKSSSGDIDRYGPDFMVINNVVMVTINYRPQSLGFMRVKTDGIPGKVVSKDLVAAMHWIRDNIDFFGGHPDEVTIYGQNASGFSVALPIISPMGHSI